MTAADADAAARIVVTGGGDPSAAELAALIVALTPSGPPPPAATAPAWTRAALLENVGGRRPARPSDLALPALPD